MYCVGLMLMVSVLAGYLVGFVAYLCRLTQFSLSRPHLTRAVLVMGQLTLIRLLPVGQPRSTYGSGHLYARWVEAKCNVLTKCNTFLAFRQLPHHQNCRQKCTVLRSYIAYIA